MTDGGIIVGGSNLLLRQAQQRTSLGLTIGTDVQAYDAQLADALGCFDGNIVGASNCCRVWGDSTDILDSALAPGIKQCVDHWWISGRHHRPGDCRRWHRRERKRGARTNGLGSAPLQTQPTSTQQERQ